VGVPTSAGAFAPGQERAPEALRGVGLVEKLQAAGFEVAEFGDSPVWRWRPDRSNPRAQNLGAVVEIARETARRVEVALGEARPLLVLGGDCTVELGTVAGHVALGESVGLVYFDIHPDLNIPASVQQGALDWMGVAHLLGEPGSTPELSGFGPRTPLLRDDEILLFSYGLEQATSFEREAMERRGLERVPLEEVAADPSGTARRALEGFGSRFDRLLVHFDVDTIDFTDAPLSEETGRNQGLSFEQAMQALEELAESAHLSAVTVTELNPQHSDEAGTEIARFVDGLVRALG
jgi:arginase